MAEHRPTPAVQGAGRAAGSAPPKDRHIGGLGRKSHHLVEAGLHPDGADPDGGGVADASHLKYTTLVV